MFGGKSMAVVWCTVDRCGVGLSFDAFNWVLW